METVRGCKWVDEIVADVPYIMNETYLKEIMVKHRYQLLIFSINGIERSLRLTSLRHTNEKKYHFSYQQD